MPQHLIKTLLQELPRHAEEGGDCYSVPRLALINAISRQHAVEACVAENTVLLCERLLETLSVLNGKHLSQGEWRFVSFPAQLLATSVLTALSDDASRLFAANFWNTQDTDNFIKDKQREVLRHVETARNDHHAQRQASPIRYCYVAWSIIKLDGNILFYQREDTRKRHDKASGDYGLIGGRANQNDISMKDKAALLKELQSPHSEVIKDALPETLKRELREEAGLEFDLHYTFKPWRKLKPYRQVQGAAPNHALTEYYLDIFQMDLTLEGYLFLRQKIQMDERLVWFSIEDMAQGTTSDGKIPYIKALYEDFADDRVALADALMALPDSFSSNYLYEPKKYGLLLPRDHTLPLRAGMLGKEKAVDLHLTERQFTILLGLAAHLRRFEFAAVDQDIKFHPHGWVEVAEKSALQSELIALADAIRIPNLAIENHRDFLFRLSLTPEVVYFDDSLFALAVKGNDMASTEAKIPATLRRASFATVFGQVKEKTETFTLTLEFAHNLQKLAARPHGNDNADALKIEDAYKKSLHKNSAFLAFGLRNLIRQENSVVKFVLDFTVA